MKLQFLSCTITKNMSNDLMCYDVSIVPGLKVCVRCSFGLSEILHGKSNSPLTSNVNTLSIESEINDEIHSCEMTLNQVCMSQFYVCSNRYNTIIYTIILIHKSRKK